MHVREATEADVAAIEAVVDADLDASRLLHERTVLVAETDGEIQGFLSYDTWSETVHVSTMAGEPEVVDALLEEPQRFADEEELPVEIVVPDPDVELRSVVETAGFERVGRGPLFEGDPSHRYRYNVD